MNLKNKTAWVCGSTQGIGLATAQQLAAAGATVVLIARDETKLKAALETLEQPNQQVHQFLVADLNNTDALADKLQTFLAKNPAVHILINNTGGPKGGVLIDAKTSDLTAAFNGHIIAAHILAQAAFPAMKNAGFGRIINITSIGQKQPINGLGVSNTIRGAMGSWAKTMANELGPDGITVNNVLPGFTDTHRLKEVNAARATTLNQSIEAVETVLKADTPIRRFVDPKETAALICFLCSDAAAAISGTNIPVDGGRTTSM